MTIRTSKAILDLAYSQDFFSTSKMISRATFKNKSRSKTARPSAVEQTFEMLDDSKMISGIIYGYFDVKFSSFIYTLYAFLK